jgi:hypothetical protein
MLDFSYLLAASRIKGRGDEIPFLAVVQLGRCRAPFATGVLSPITVAADPAATDLNLSTARQACNTPSCGVRHSPYPFLGWLTPTRLESGSLSSLQSRD